MNTNPSKVKVGYGYRLLGQDESYKPGDECITPYNTSWHPTEGTGEIKTYSSSYSFRRRIDVGTGYRLVGEDEPTLLGDDCIMMHALNPNWRAIAETTTSLRRWWGDTLDTGGIAYRRKVGTVAGKADTDPVTFTVYSDTSSNNIMGEVIIWTAKKAGYSYRSAPDVPPTMFAIDRAKKELIPVDRVFPSYNQAVIGTDDLKRILTLLSTPYAPPAPVGPSIHGYQASYSKGAFVVTFGCARIAIGMLRKVMECTGHWENDGANRAVHAITLDSGKTLTMDQIRETLEYVNKVNGPGGP